MFKFKLLRPIQKQFLLSSSFGTGIGKKFFPGRPVPFVTVQNLEREITAKKIKTKKNDVPIKVVVSRKEDFEPVMEFLLEDFCKGEPICQAIEATPDELRPYFSDMLAHCISSGFSFMALDPENNIICSQNSRVLDFHDISRIPNYIFQPKNDYGEEIDSGIYKNRKCNQIEILNQTLLGTLPHFIPDGNTVIDLLKTGVHPTYFQQGIGLKVSMLINERAKSKGINYSISVATSKASLKMAEKSGYTKATSIKYNQFMDHKIPIFEKLPDGSTECQLVYLKL